MDVFLAIASKRDWRSYEASRAIEPALEERILDAGRLAGSARNRQPCRLVVVGSSAARARLAGCVYVPANVTDAALVVGIATPGGRAAFDAGRCAQNMMLAAWEAGVVSCPNGFADQAAADAALELADGEQAITVLTFAYPRRPADPARQDARSWSSQADRRPLAELVRRT